MARHLLSVLVNDYPGLLSKVSGLFSRRNFNIESLAVGSSEIPGRSRITIVTSGDDDTVDQISKQLNKLIDVIEIEILPQKDSVQRELVLVKVAVTPETRPEIIQIVNIFRAKIVDISHSALTIEITGQADKIAALTGLLEPFKIIQIVRTGVVAIKRS